MHVFWRAAVIDDERAATDCLCHMCVDLAVRIHRAGHVPAAMGAQQNAVLRAVLWHCPHSRNSPGIGFDIIDAARLTGYPLPLLEHVTYFVEWHLQVCFQRRHPFHVKLVQLFGLLACHRLCLRSRGYGTLSSDDQIEPARRQLDLAAAFAGEHRHHLLGEDLHLLLCLLSLEAAEFEPTEEAE